MAGKGKFDMSRKDILIDSYKKKTEEVEHLHHELKQMKEKDLRNKSKLKKLEALINGKKSGDFLLFNIKDELSKAKNHIEDLEADLSKKDSQLNDMTLKKKRLEKDIYYYEKKLKEIIESQRYMMKDLSRHKKNYVEISKISDQMKAQYNKLHDKVAFLEAENIQLKKAASNKKGGMIVNEVFKEVMMIL